MTCYFIKRWSNLGIWICHPVSCRVSKSFTMPYLKTYSLFTLDIWHVVVDRNCLVFCLHGVQKIPIKVIIEQWPALYAINVLIANLRVRSKQGKHGKLFFLSLNNVLIFVEIVYLISNYLSCWYFYIFKKEPFDKLLGLLYFASMLW